MKILRVFPRRTNFTPKDNLVVIGSPGLWRPEAEKVERSSALAYQAKMTPSLSFPFMV